MVGHTNSAEAQLSNGEVQVRISGAYSMSGLYSIVNFMYQTHLVATCSGFRLSFIH